MLWSVFLVFSCPDHLVSLSVSCVLVISSMQLLMFSRLSVLSNKKVENCRQHDGPCKFRSNGRARFQQYCNFADCDPLLSVNCFGHNTTPTPTTVSCVIIPIATYCFSVLCVLQCLDCDLSLSYSPQVRQMVGLLIVLRGDVLQIVVNLCHWRRNSSYPPRVQCFLNTSNFPLN